MQIIVAEDDRLLGETIQALLASYGHSVRLANAGDKALQLFLDKRCRIFFSDWVMPGMDGIELVQRIRTLGGNDYCYFIMLTANTREGNFETAMAAGVDDFLVKPVDREQLIARLHVAERIMNYMGHIRRLESLLPICSYCKRIRDERNEWTQFETYLHDRAGTDFSHGVCPDCMKKYFAQ